LPVQYETYRSIIAVLSEENNGAHKIWVLQERIGYQQNSRGRLNHIYYSLLKIIHNKLMPPPFDICPNIFVNH
jgi:hypothetical protein